MNINFLAMIVAALVPTILGFLWYNPKTFAPLWMREIRMTEAEAKSGSLLVTFGVSLFFSFVMAFLMNIISHHDAFVGGSMYYLTNGTMKPEVGSELEKWYSYYMANISDSCRTFKHGAYHGAMIGGLMIVLPVTAINSTFEKRGWKYVLVTAGFWIISLGLMGGIIAAWK